MDRRELLARGYPGRLIEYANADPWLDTTEFAAAKRWVAQHRCHVTGRSRKERALLEIRYTGIGIRYDVVCCCGKSKDVSDYASW